MKHALSRLRSFFLAPASAEPLALLRISVASILLIQAALCSSEFFDWYGPSGLLQGNVLAGFSWPVPTMAQVLHVLVGWKIPETLALIGFGVAYVVSLLALLIGMRTRLAATIAWATHLVLGVGHTMHYGIDLFAHIALFYFIWMPVGNAWSWDVREGRRENRATPLTGLSLRVWQIHLAIAYFCSGFDKAHGAQWWNGEAIWRSLMLPLYRQFDFSWLSHVPWIAVGLGWGTMLIEMGYPFFIFPRKTRMLWITLTVSMHVAIALFLGLQLFGALMALLTISAFGVRPQNYEPLAEISLSPSLEAEA